MRLVLTHPQDKGPNFGISLGPLFDYPCWLSKFCFPFLAYITSSRQNVVRKCLTARNKEHTVPGSAETFILRLSHQNYTHLCWNWFKKCLVARMESSTKATSSKWSLSKFCTSASTAQLESTAPSLNFNDWFPVATWRGCNWLLRFNMLQ